MIDSGEFLIAIEIAFEGKYLAALDSSYQQVPVL